jgi:predicted Zn-dependent peptidase
MIAFEKHTLSNGLTVIAHQDTTTPVAALNLLYDVGARDENPHRTGFAHLFEHLMFGGSVNIPDFDKPLQAAGGTSNAFTSNDITNYYETIPLPNLETLFWLESDRLLSLAFTEKSLEVQRSVVIEEFKQRYINQPYGDIWHLLRKAAFTTHPYQWPTIGKEISHIEEATMEDVKAFFFKHYTPANGILCVAGNINPGTSFRLAEKWFGTLPHREKYVRQLPSEPKQRNPVVVSVERKVPQSMFLRAWHMPDRRHQAYHTVDLMSDLLGRGKSSRLYQRLVMEQQVFTEINCYVTGELDPGLFVISGMLVPGISMDKAEQEVSAVLNTLRQQAVQEEELEKVRNKYLSSKGFEDASVSSKAMNLCYFELLEDAGMVNSEESKYRAVTPAGMNKLAMEVLAPENSVTLYYHANPNAHE